MVGLAVLQALVQNGAQELRLRSVVRHRPACRSFKNL